MTSGAPLILRWLDAFLPADQAAEGDERIRGRALVGGCWLLVAVVTIGYTARIAFGDLEPVLHAVLLSCDGLLIAIPFLHRRGVPTSLLGHGPPLAMTVLISLVAGLQVGLSTPIIATVPLVPIMAAFFCGTRAAAGYTIAMAFLLGALGLLPAGQGGLEDVYRPMRGLIAILVAVMTTGLMALYETQVRWARWRIRQGDERYLVAAEVSRDGLFEEDREAGRLSMSDSLVRMLGRDPAEGATVASLADLVAPEDRSGLEELLASLTARGRAVGELRFVTGDGSRLWCEVSAGSVEDHRIVGSVRDIAERKAAEGVKDEFVAVVSHELRTPLTSIYGSLRLLATPLIAPAEAGRLLEIATRNTERLRALVDDLLDLQRLRLDGARLDPAARDLNDLAGEAIELHREMIEAHGARVAFEPAGRPVVADVDGARLLQVLGNLLGNAAKFAPAGTSIDLAVAAVDGQARLEVRDRGPGVPPEAVDRIFERFGQAERSSQRSKEGAGLGLSVARILVEAHGGTLTYHPRPGGGSIFRIAIRLA